MPIVITIYPVYFLIFFGVQMPLLVLQFWHSIAQQLAKLIDDYLCTRRLYIDVSLFFFSSIEADIISNYK